MLVTYLGIAQQSKYGAEGGDLTKQMGKMLTIGKPGYRLHN